MLDPPVSSDYCSMIPDRFKLTIDSMTDGARTLKDAKSGFANELAWYGVDTSSLNTLARIGDWVEQQLPDLKRRLDLAIAWANSQQKPNMAMSGPVYLSEPVLSAADAQKKGKELAARMEALDRGTEDAGKEAHRIALELQLYANDPEVTAAFFTSLDPPARLTMLPHSLYATGSDTAAEDLKIFSRALGTAVSAEYLQTPGMDKVEEMLTAKAKYPAQAWDRLALLQHGNFPTDFIETAAKNLALDEFAKHPDQDWRGGGHAAARLGLASSTVALALDLLGKDGVAARNVLWGMNPGDYRKTFTEIFDHAKYEDEVADAFGRAIEAGAGVHDSEPGEHHPEEAQFAFEAMIVAGDYGHDVPWTMKDSMVNLGISYRHELASGARFDDAYNRDSAMKKPDDWTDIHGLNPSFYLAQRDTYDFLKTFVGSEYETDRFDEEMGAFREQLLMGAAKYDADAIKVGKEDPGAFKDAAGALGDLGGLQYAATLKVRGDMDEFDKKVRGVMADVLTLGLGEITPAGKALEYSWKAVQFMGGKALENWVEGDPDDSRVGHATSARDAFINMQRYEMARYLYAGDYPAEPPPPKEFLNSGGTLKSYGELYADAQAEARVSGQDANEIFHDKINELSRWTDKTDVPDNGNTYDDKIKEGTDALSSLQAQTAAKGYED